MPENILQEEELRMREQLRSGAPQVLNQPYYENSAMRRARANMKVLRDQNPDKEARNRQISRETGIHYNVLREDEAAATDHEEDLRIQKFLSGAPLTSVWMSNPDNTGLAKDDIEALANVEFEYKNRSLADKAVDQAYGVGRSMKREFHRFLPGLEQSLYQMIGSVAGIIENQREVNKEYYKDVPGAEKLRGMITPKWEEIQVFPGQREGESPMSFVKDTMLQRAKEIGEQELSKFELPEELRGRLIENPQYLLNGEWLTQNLGETARSLIPTVVASLVAGPAAGAAIGGGMEGSDLYASLTEDGVDPKKAADAAISYGFVSAILNKIGLERFMKKIPTGKLRDRMMHRLVSGATEATTEYLEEPFQAGFDAWARGDDLDTATAKVLESLKNVEVIPGSFILGGAMSASLSDAKNGKQSAKTYTDRQVNINRAVQATKLMQRDPASVQNYLETIGFDEDVYISAEGIKTLFQEDPRVASEIFQKLGVDPQQVLNDVAAGGNIKTTTSKLHGYLTEQQFAKIIDDIKPTPGAYTNREAGEIAGDDMIRLERIANERLQDEQNFQQELDRIRTDITEKVTPLRKFQGIDVAAAVEENINQIQAFANRMAIHTGLDRTEFLKRISYQRRLAASENVDTHLQGMTQELAQFSAEKGININDADQNFTELILSGAKTVETRETPSLRPYVGKRVGIIRTGQGQAMLMGFADVVEEIEYTSEEEFLADQKNHQVGRDSKYFKSKGFGYRFENVEKIDPLPITSKGIVSRSLFQDSAQVAAFRKANALPELKLRSDGSHPTQIAGTKSTYQKMFALVPKAVQAAGKFLDFGAGRNIAAQALPNSNVQSFEPFPMAGFTPTYSDSSAIPSEAFQAVFSNAVLNVVPQDIRDGIVDEMGRVVAPGGQIFVNVRGRDVLNAKHVQIAQDPLEVIVEGNGAYQKGFTKEELRSYLQDRLGSNFSVEVSTKFGAVAAVATKLGSQATEVSRATKRTSNALGVETTPGAVAPTQTLYSARSWTEQEQEQVRELAATFGIEEAKVNAWIADIDNAMARVLANPEELDFESETEQLYSALKPNSDPHYTVSLDFSTLCRKRYELMATIEAIQVQLGRAVDKDTWVTIRQKLNDLGHNVSCGACYVDSKRMEAGKFINDFIDSHPEEDPQQFLTQAGIDKLAQEKPKLYKEFKLKLGSNNAKTPESRTDYRGEIREYFGTSKAGPGRVAKMNSKSGLRWQSWSDFEVPHLMDAMQAILDMSLVKLMGHAYTKVPEFVRTLGKTGLMINMSLIPKGSGLANGKLVFDPKEGIDFDEAMKLRNRFETTAGVVAIGVGDEHISTMLADPRIDYIIPYHASGLSGAIARVFGMDGWVDYTDVQNDDIADFELFHQKVGKGNAKLDGFYAAKDWKNYRKAAKAAGLVSIDTTEYWDAKRSGDENAAAYLAMAAERGVKPRFSGKTYASGKSIRDFTQEKGYWKLLIDRKSYDHSGKGIVQKPVKPEYDMQDINKIYDQAIKQGIPAGAVAPVVKQVVKAIKTGEKFTVEQAESVKLGATSFMADGSYVVKFFEEADVSTIYHETAHIFLQEMASIYEQNMGDDQFMADFGVIMNFTGNTDGNFTREQHEKFARGFELYLLEGKAPSVEMENAFSRFKRWMVALYESIKAFQRRHNVKLNPSIRALFDRLVENKNSMAEAILQYGIDPLTDKAMNDLGIIPEDQDYLKRLITKGQTKALDKMQIEQSRSYRKNVTRWRQEAEAEANTHPQEVLIKKIQDLAGLNLPEIMSRFGNIMSELPRRNPPLFRANGMVLDKAAVELGYENAEDLIEVVRRFVPKEQLVETAFTRRVNEDASRFRAIDYLVNSPEYSQYMEIVNRYYNGDLAQAAKEVNPNTKGNEKKGIAPKAKPAKAISREAFRLYAEKVMGQKSVAEAVRQDNYLNAMKKAMSAEKKAANKGDYAAARAANEQVRFNFEMAKQAAKNRALRDKILRKVKALATRKSIAMPHREQIRSLVERFGLAEGYAPQEPEKLGPLSSFLQPDPENHIEGFPASDMFLGTGTIKYQNMAFEQFQELADLLDYLAGRGRDVLNATMADGKTAIKEAAELSVEETRNLEGRHTWRKFSALRKLSDVGREAMSYLNSFQFIMIAKGGYQNVGTNRQESLTEKFILNPLISAQNRLDVRIESLNAAMKPHLDQLYKTIQRWNKVYGEFSTQVPVPALMREDGQLGWTGEQVMAIALNMGNQGNQERLFAGYPDLTPDTVETLLNRLSEQDWDAIQGIWDVIDSQYAETNEVHKRVNNFAIKKIPAKPFMRFGKEYKGGYYPARFAGDLAISAKTMKVQEFNEQDDLMSRQDAIRQVPRTRSGMTIERQSGVTLPLKLNLSVALEHLNDVARYIELTEAVRDSDRIMKNEEWAKETARFLGRQVYDSLRPALKYFARPVRESSDRNTDRVVSGLRGMATAFMLGWNASVAVKQWFSSPAAMGDIGVKAYAKGYAHMLKNPVAGFTRMTELSSYMRGRGENFDKELHDMFKRMKPNQKALVFGDKRVTFEDVRNWGFIPIRLVDYFTVTPIWNGAFDKRMDETGGDIEESVKYADDAIRRTQPSAQPIDLTKFQQQSGVLRLFSTFMTFTLGKYGQRQRLHYKAWRAGKLSTVDYAWHGFLEAVVPGVGMSIMFAFIYGKDLDDEETWADIAKDLGLYTVATGIPFIGQFLNTAFGKAGGASDSAALEGFKLAERTLKAGGKVITEGDDEAWQQFGWQMLRLVSFFSRIPISRVVDKFRKGMEQDEAGFPGLQYLFPEPKK